MTHIIQFPGNRIPESGALPAAHVDEIQIVDDSGESLEFTFEEAVLAKQAVEGLLEHVQGARLDLSMDSRISRARLVEEYGLGQVVRMMGQSGRQDWMKHPAFYGALARRFLVDVLSGEDSDQDEDEVETPTGGLRLLKPDAALDNKT